MRTEGRLEPLINYLTSMPRLIVTLAELAANMSNAVLWQTAIFNYAFFAVVFGAFTAAIIGVYGVATNKEVERRLRTILALLVVAGAAFGVVSDAVNRHDSLAAQQELNDNLARLQSPITNTTVTYDVEIPIRDPRLKHLRDVIIDSAHKQEYKYNHATPPMAVLPTIPLTDILARLPPMDDGSYFLRSMDIEFEFYRPTFPPSPNYGYVRSGSVVSLPYAYDAPDLLLSTNYLVPPDKAIGKFLQVPGMLRRSQPTGTPYSIELCDCNEWFTKPAPFVSAYDVPIARAYRSTRIDSTVDFRGSRMFVHIRPDFLQLGALNLDVTRGARLKLLTLSIDGANYHVDLKKAVIGEAPLFKYYEWTIPENWDPQSHTIP